MNAWYFEDFEYEDFEQARDAPAVFSLVVGSEGRGVGESS